MANSNKWHLSNNKLCIKRFNGVKYCLHGPLAPSRRISLEYSTSGKQKVESKKKSRPTPNYGGRPYADLRFWKHFQKLFKRRVPIYELTLGKTY